MLRIANIASNPDAVWDGTIYSARLTYVPEPTSLAITAAVAVLAGRRRRRTGAIAGR